MPPLHHRSVPSLQHSSSSCCQEKKKPLFKVVGRSLVKMGKIPPGCCRLLWKRLRSSAALHSNEGIHLLLLEVCLKNERDLIVQLQRSIMEGFRHITKDRNGCPSAFIEQL